MRSGHKVALSEWNTKVAADVAPPWQSPDKTRRHRFPIHRPSLCRGRPSRLCLMSSPSGSHQWSRPHYSRPFLAILILSPISRRCLILGRSRLRRVRLPSEVACSIRCPTRSA